MIHNDHGFLINTDGIHQDFHDLKARVYDPCGFKCFQPMAELESIEYGAAAFTINDFSIKFRVAKITPTKVGQFVTCWKRIANGPIQPYDSADPFDFFIISARKDTHFGQFIFPKSILVKQSVLSRQGKGGKRGIRVYPPWDQPLNQQAKKTQQWQVQYFLEVPPKNDPDYARTKMLLQLG